MDTASKLPFTLQVIKRFPRVSCQEGQLFLRDKQEVERRGIVTLSVEENDDIELLFDSADSGARLYLEALDMLPRNNREMEYDAEGRRYRRPAEEPFVLYQANCGVDALCVNRFEISVFCEHTWYYGSLQVLPKPMNIEEWNQMKEELEKEMVGLSQDLLRRSIGLERQRVRELPPEILHDFIVMKSSAQSVFAALTDIAKNPRCEIATQYKRVGNSRICRLDEKSMRRYATRAGSEATYEVPEKVTKYDIQDNRLLKRMVLDYEKRLNRFLELLEEEYGAKVLQQNQLGKSVTEFYQLAQKLKKMTLLLRTKDWYLEVGDVMQPYIPHSFIMDTRYNILYQMWLRGKQERFPMEFPGQPSYAWRQSSYLYEIWCYVKIVHLLAEEFELEEESWNCLFSERTWLPFLHEGSAIGLYNDEVSLKLVYDRPLSSSSQDTNLKEPLYIAKTQEYSKQHNRPDILIHVYDRKKEWYIGAIVLECKYRKLNSFWNESNERSSIGQLQAYYNNTRSEYLFGGKGKRLNIRPVKKVIVLTPDVQGEGKCQDDFGILIKTFKPMDTEDLGTSLRGELLELILELRGISEELK